MIRYLKPIFFYGFVALVAGIGQFSVCFIGRKGVVLYGIVSGLCGGLGSGSIAAAPFYILWTNFHSSSKWIVAGVYLLMTNFIQDGLLYPLFRVIWWGQNDIPTTPAQIEK